MSDTICVPREDLVQMREALVTQVVWVTQKRVAEVNRAIALADFLLGESSPLTENCTIDDVRGPWNLGSDRRPGG